MSPAVAEANGRTITDAIEQSIKRLIDQTAEPTTEPPTDQTAEPTTEPTTEPPTDTVGIRCGTSLLETQMRLPDSTDDAQPTDDACTGDPDVVNMFSRTNTANTADDYAHRGSTLQSMPYYVYIAHVRPHARNKLPPQHAHVVEFEQHYAKSKAYVQVVRLADINIPTIDGFQCPTWQQDPEQNSLLMQILCFPWRCTDPHKCDCTSKFTQMVSNGECQGSDSSNAQPVSTSRRRYTFERSWRLRWSEIKVLAARADTKIDIARKKLVACLHREYFLVAFTAQIS